MQKIRISIENSIKVGWLTDKFDNYVTPSILNPTAKE